jgi:hypothetical protein
MDMMHRNILFFSLLLGCSKTAPVTPDSGEGPSDDVHVRTCDVTVPQTVPAHRSMDHYYRDPIVFMLSDPIEEASVITDVAGETALSEDGMMVTFTPSGLLSPSTEYSMILDYCYGQPEITFSTSHYGAPIEASADLENSTFVLDFTTGQYIVGENAGDLLNSVFTRDVLVQFEEVDGSNTQVVAAIGMPNASTVAQDMCGRTISVDVALDVLPLVSGGEENFIFGAMGGQLRFDSIEFEGTIASDVGSLGGLTYHAVLGMAELVNVLPEFGGESVGCDLAENLGIPCEPCANDPDANCIAIAAKGITGTATDIELEMITEQGTHPDCDPED